MARGDEGTECDAQVSSQRHERAARWRSCSLFSGRRTRSVIRIPAEPKLDMDGDDFMPAGTDRRWSSKSQARGQRRTPLPHLVEALALHADGNLLELSHGALPRCFRV